MRCAQKALALTRPQNLFWISQAALRLALLVALALARTKFAMTVVMKMQLLSSA